MFELHAAVVMVTDGGFGFVWFVFFLALYLSRNLAVTSVAELGSPGRF